MILPDVNVLVYAFRRDTPHHRICRVWLQEVVAADSAFAVNGSVLSGFLRIVTHPAVFERPSTLRAALGFCHAIREQPNCREVSPGGRHWEIFERLCTETVATGNLVPDAWLAAIAIESGCRLATFDRDFAGFRGLRTVSLEI